MSKLEVISFNKQIFHAVSLSGGKDSTAMLLLMIERGLPINTVLWADTGMEFPEMYDHIRKVDDYLYRERGMGFNPKDETYMTCYQQYNFLGETMYPEALACKSYLEIAETFLNRLQAQVEKVKAFRAARNVPYAVLGAEACLPPSEESLQGKLIVLRPTSLAPEYRTADCQLGFALSGFGCTPGARGRAVYFEELYSGERCRWDASDILGVANPEKIPDWAKEKLREYEQKRTEPKKERGTAR